MTKAMTISHFGTPGSITFQSLLGFVVDECALGQIFSAGTLVFPCWYHSAIDPYCHITPTLCDRSS
jgi:hypothetical protein